MQPKFIALGINDGNFVVHAGGNAQRNFKIIFQGTALVGANLAERFLQSFKKDDGEWESWYAKCPKNKDVKLYFGPDKNKSQEATEWFATAVPERTLHNWQNEAAALIARHLRELEIPPA